MAFFFMTWRLPNSIRWAAGPLSWRQSNSARGTAYSKKRTITSVFSVSKRYLATGWSGHADRSCKRTVGSRADRRGVPGRWVSHLTPWGTLSWILTREGNEGNASRPQKRIYANLRDDKCKIYYDIPGRAWYRIADTIDMEWLEQQRFHMGSGFFV